MRPFLRFSQYYKGPGPSTISIFVDGSDDYPFTADDTTYVLHLYEADFEAA